MPPRTKHFRAAVESWSEPMLSRKIFARAVAKLLGALLDALKLVQNVRWVRYSVRSFCNWFDARLDEEGAEIRRNPPLVSGSAEVVDYYVDAVNLSQPGRLAGAYAPFARRRLASSAEDAARSAAEARRGAYGKPYAN